jgi:hypothetical protein
MATEYRPEPEMVERCMKAMREARAATTFGSLDGIEEAIVRAILREAVAYMMERRASPPTQDNAA